MCDGAAVNGTTLREFEKLIDERDKGWTAKEHDILYMFPSCFTLTLLWFYLTYLCQVHGTLTAHRM